MEENVNKKVRTKKTEEPMEKPKNLFQRLNAVQQEVAPVRKESVNGLKYEILSHDAVTKTVRDSIARNGIVIVPIEAVLDQKGSLFGISLKVDFVNIDAPEDKLTVSEWIPLNTANGVTEKTFGGAYSYAYKYVLLKTFMLETGEDSDYTADEPRPTRNDQLDSQPITEAQHKELLKVIAGNEKKFELICKHNNVESLLELNQDQYRRALKFASTDYINRKVA